jgi:hypothetical protein
VTIQSMLLLNEPDEKFQSGRGSPFSANMQDRYTFSVVAAD